MVNKEAESVTDIAMIISDQRMPGMTGMELLKQAQLIAPDTIRIILTGFMDHQDTVEALNSCGLFRYLLKPWDQHDLVTTVQAGLQHYELIRQNRRLQEDTNRQNTELIGLNATLKERVNELHKRNGELAQASQQLKKDVFESLAMLLRVLEIHSPGLVGHLRRVARNVQRIGIQMKLPEKELHVGVTAALLHDVGFEGVPLKANVFRTEEEKSLYAQHCRISMEAVTHLSHLKPAASEIFSHHERFDGHGYPLGLKGDRIPLGARIIAVADEYDYLVAPSGILIPDLHLTALNYIERERGRAFDPVVVDAFVGCSTDRQEKVLALSHAELRDGMVLAKNLYSKQRTLLAPEGTILTEALIQHLLRLQDKKIIEGPIWVEAQIYPATLPSR
jgi:response regulator RpfG family c-di-GMP phosphodiesterase